jgi:predicted nucleotidyltransferase
VNKFEKMGLLQADVSTLMEGFKRIHNLQKAVLFGSRAKGSYKPGSDVDLALYGDNLSRDDLLALSYWLNQETLLPYKIDLLLYQDIDKAVQDHIERVGITVYTRGT